MATEQQKFGIGGLLLIVSTALILGVTTVSSAFPSLFAGIASLIMAAGTLLIGLSGDDAGV